VKNATRVLAALLMAASPALLHAQKREDFLQIQRDVAQLQDEVRQLQRSQDEKMAALTTLVQQALDASMKTSAGLGKLQENLTQSLNDQQLKVAGPVATLSSKVDQMSQDFGAMRETVADLARRFADMNSKLNDISTAVRTLSAPPAPPPSATAPGASAAVPGGPPPGVTAQSLYEDARRDYSSGMYDLAQQEFANVIKYFPMDDYAAASQYYIGMIYDSAKQYDDAIQAFDAAVNNFGENPKTPEALYMKGVDQMKSGKKTAAAATFKDFLKRYPTHENAARARAHLRELGMSTSSGRRRRK
jgi:tol-pal system protein YbgF